MKRFQALRRSVRIALGLAIVAYLAIGMSGGCNAYKRPPALNPEERALLEGAPLPYSVTVAWWDEQTKTGQNPEAYGDALAKIVTTSGAFATARYDRSSAPSGQDLVATSTGLYCNSAVIPIFSIVSLGIIPTIFQDEHCEGMLLRTAPGRPKSEGVQISVRYKGPVIMGWVAVMAGALPGWSYGSVDQDARFAERFRVEVVHRRADIERLVSQESAND